MCGSGGIALTPIGECVKPRCRAPVFAELVTPDAPRLCIDCAPPFVEGQEKLRSLYERSGGRLPPYYGRDLFSL
jgi:hypothetical protein